MRPKRGGRGSAPAWALLGLAAATLPAEAEAQHLVVREDGTYPPESRVESPATGISFVIPSGFTAQMDAETGLFLLVGDGVRAALWAYSHATPEDLADVMTGDLEDLGLVLSADEVSEATGGVLAGTFDVLSVEGRGRLHAAALRGSQGNGLGIAALGAAGQDAGLRDLVSRVRSSAEFTTPEAASWSREVAGSVLSSDTETSDHSMDPTGHVSTGSSSNVRIVLCVDGSYEYASESLMVFSTAEAVGSSEGGDEHVGSWSLVADIVGTAWLVLEPLDGDERVYEVDVRDGIMTLGGRTYEVGPGGC